MNDPDDDPWHEARPHKSNDGQARYIRADLYAAVEAERDDLRRQIKIVQNAARSLEVSGREIARHDLMRAEKLFAESKPEVIDSEREANALLTEENLRLEQENDQLRAEVERLNKLAAAISKDCNETALQRNAAQNEASQLRARLDAAASDFEHIREYWNQDQNEVAMSDALWHIMEVCDNAIDSIRGIERNGRIKPPASADPKP